MPSTALFPESSFPPADSLRADYESKIHQGKIRMRAKTAVLAGLARDVAAILPYTIVRMENIGSMFADYRIVIYENDSADGTKDILRAWAERNPRVHVRSEDSGDPVNPCARCLKRAERMARYRNACLESVRAEAASFDYVLLVDTDLEGGWSPDGIANTFGHDDWDFVGSNGLIYKRKRMRPNGSLQYDAWAFRTDEAFSPLSTEEVNLMKWNRGEALVPVTCCFGGLGIYRMEAYLAGHYAGHDVDHVTHQQVSRSKGFNRVFLNPSQFALYGRRRRSYDPFILPMLRLVTAIPGFERWRATFRPIEFPPIR